WLTERAAGPEATPAAPPDVVAPKARTSAAPTTVPTQDSARRSPSTLRRQLGQAERDLAAATSARDDLATRMSATNAHWELSELAEQLAAAQARVAAMEEAWLALATEAEDLGLSS